MGLCPSSTPCCYLIFFLTLFSLSPSSSSVVDNETALLLEAYKYFDPIRSISNQTNPPSPHPSSPPTLPVLTLPSLEQMNDPYFLQQQELICHHLCSQFQIVPTISDKLEVPQNWTKYFCNSFSISCERKRKILPTLLKKYKPQQMNWKEKCSRIFSRTKKKKRRSELVVFAVASKPMTYYGMLVATAIKYDLKLVTVGWQIARNQTIPKNYYFGYKIISVFNILTKCHSRNFINNNTIVMVVDGTDVLFQAGPDKILKQFHAMNHSIVFGGEAPASVRTDFTERKYGQQIRDFLWRTNRTKEFDGSMLRKPELREKELKFMFLNSGCFIGRVGHLLEFYKYWVNPPYFKIKKTGYGLYVAKDQPRRVIFPIKTLWDARTKLNFSSHWPDAYFRRDQFTAIHMYLDGVADSSVDAQGKIFLSTFMGGAAGLGHYLWKDSQNLTVSIQTNTTPAVLHFAGASKYLQCLSKYVKTFMDRRELDDLFSGDWRDQLVMLDANLDLVSSSLVTSDLVKTWIPRYPMHCPPQKVARNDSNSSFTANELG
jgi:hypothetical protein